MYPWTIEKGSSSYLRCCILGGIQKDINEGAAEMEKTPLQQKLDEFGTQLSKVNDWGGR